MTNNDSNQPFETPWNEDVAPSSMTVNVGNAMLDMHPQNLPVLQSQAQPMVEEEYFENTTVISKLAEGMRFVGNAVLRGPFSVSGFVQGNLTQAHNAQASVVVTETGRVVGDITAQKISVMGHTDGVLDAGQGEVSLHATATVHGLVRYGHIHVNGADLNATLERVQPASNAL